MPPSTSSESTKDKCRVCNNNCGVFLDIFKCLEDRKYYEEIQKCLPLKVSRKDKISSKICHRCVYNLKLCCELIEQFKISQALRLERVNPVEVCYLCFADKGALFDIKTNSFEAECTACKIEACLPCKCHRNETADCTSNGLHVKGHTCDIAEKHASGYSWKCIQQFPGTL